jgi:hypothetical protein
VFERGAPDDGVHPRYDRMPRLTPVASFKQGVAGSSPARLSSFFESALGRKRSLHTLAHLDWAL